MRPNMTHVMGKVAHGTYPSPQFVITLPASLEEIMTAGGGGGGRLNFIATENVAHSLNISASAVAEASFVLRLWILLQPTDRLTDLSKKYLTNKQTNQQIN